MKVCPMSKFIVLNEAQCEALVTRKHAFDAVEDVFSAMAKGEAYNFPVIREAIGYADALYGFKSGFDKTGKVLGVKSGGYWPNNVKSGLTNHQSTVCLFNPDTGELSAIVAGNYLTAIRTAASSAVSIAHLARKDSRILGMVGAGHQSIFQLRAAVEQRDFQKVVAWNPHPEMLPRLAKVVEELGLPFEAVDPKTLGQEADVIITITSAFEPLLKSDWIKPGTHLACMGTDTKGKMEVEPELVARASVFSDEISQSISIGEAQHACKDGLVSGDEITPIGTVINGNHGGRSSNDDVTLFDGTGVGLQDLAVASVATKMSAHLENVAIIDL